MSLTAHDDRHDAAEIESPVHVLPSGEGASRIFDFLAGFRDVAATGRDMTGELWSRPAVLVEARGTRLVLALSLTGRQRHALAASPEISLSLHGRRRFATVSGLAREVADGGQLESAWPFVWKVALPPVREGEGVALLEVEPRRGEVWDSAERSRFEVAFV